MLKLSMKYIRAGLSVAFLIVNLSLQAQVPQGINYQAMALDTAGNPLQNQTIRLRLGIVELNSSNSPVFQETHLISTDGNGIFALQIGLGTALINTMDSVNWENSPVFLKVEMDKTGGTNYDLIGFTEFFSVPYALRAAYGPDEDADPANEIQNLSLQNGSLSISGGNTVNLNDLLEVDANRILFADDRDNTGFSIPLDSGTAAVRNALFGVGTGNATMTGEQNVLVGHRSGQSLTSGYNNTYMGNHAGRLTTTGYGNVALGNGAGEKNLAGQYNIYLGDQAGKNGLGAYNTIIGKSAGYSLTTGNNNVFVGTNAGVYNQTGSNNVFLGMNAGFNELGSNRLYIDNSNTASPLVYGEFENDLLRVNGDLDITGNITQNGGPITVNPLDNDSTNELQTLSLSGQTLSISDGNSIQLPPEVDADTTNELQTLSLNANILSILGGNAVTLPEPIDADSTNELQSLSLTGQTLSISEGNTVLLPENEDNDSTNELQTLSLVGQTLSISDGNSVELPSANSSLTVDFGTFRFTEPFPNREIIINHNLNSIPSLIELNWASEFSGSDPTYHGVGQFNGSKYSSIITWSHSGSQNVSTDNTSIMSARKSDPRYAIWRVVVEEMTSTYVKLKVSQSNWTTHWIKCNWKVFK